MLNAYLSIYLGESDGTALIHSVDFIAFEIVDVLYGPAVGARGRTRGALSSKNA